MCHVFLSGIYTALHWFDSSAKGIIYGIIGLMIASGFAVAAAADLFLISKVSVLHLVCVSCKIN